MKMTFYRAATLLMLLLGALPALASISLEWEPRSSYASSTTTASVGRHHPITFANETHAFLLGGTTPDSSAANDFYLYQESTDQWTDLTNTPSAFPGTARSFGYGVVLNSAQHPKAYLGFGASPTGERLRDLWEFDMTTHTWKQLASCPGLGRRHPSMVPVYVHDDTTGSSIKWHIHVGLGDGYIGDNNDQFSNFNDYWSYDIDSDAWTPLPDFPASRRHHPFFFGIGGVSYTGLGHSDGQDPYIERDFYSFRETASSLLEGGGWGREPDFASYDVDSTTERFLQTEEARVAGTQFSIDLPLRGSTSDSIESLVGSLGFVLSGDGDNHDFMSEGEFHAFYPANSFALPVDTIVSTTTSGISSGISVATAATAVTVSQDDRNAAWWRRLPSHPGPSRWAPGSFVMRGTARVYFTSGYDRSSGTLHSDVWRIDLSPLFRKGNATVANTENTESTVADTTPSSSSSTSGAPALFPFLRSMAVTGAIWAVLHIFFY